MSTAYFQTAFLRVPLASCQTMENLDWPKLAQLIQDPQFLEALYIASPALHEEACKLEVDRLPDQKEKRVVYSLIKYLSRYATRCTPFGLFAGFSTVAIDSSATCLRIDTTGSLRKVIRLDMNYLCALAQDLEQHEAIRPLLRFYPNTSVYLANNQYRYVTYRYNEAGMRIHHLSSAEQTPYLDMVLHRAKAGSTVDELTATLTSEEITEADAQLYVNELLAAQLLVSELEPALTGDNFLHQLTDALDAIYLLQPSTALHCIKTLLHEVATDLEQIEKAQTDSSTVKFTAIETKLSQLSTPFDRKVLFQIDTYLPQTTGQLNKGLLNKLIAKIPTLLKLTPTGNKTLAEFRAKFSAKYEEEEIPLVLALDPELGIGYPAGQLNADISPLIDGLTNAAPKEGAKSITIPEEHQYLLQKMAEAQLSGAYQIDIDEDELRHLDPSQPQLPLTNSALFSVIREGGREKLVLSSFGGSTGTYLLGRFGHTDPSVLGLLHQISATEEKALANAIFADIVHLPEARTGNVITRPGLTAYQIPFLAKASVDAHHQIPITDLMIRVRGNTVHLRSKRLGQEVIPRLANAHNYANPHSLDAYCFLCDVQTQHERRTIGLVEGSYSKLFLFNPRLVLDSLILAEAQWHFKQAHVKSLISAFKARNWANLKEALASWRGQYRIPRCISLVSGDNELYVDLDAPWLAETFVNEIKSLDEFTIKEFLYRPDSAVIQSASGWHTNQFVVAFHTTSPGAKEPFVQPILRTQGDRVARQFFTGSEWLYYKLYTGIKTADWLLTEVLAPLTSRFEAAGWIDQFFFIRYADPQEHIRFRWHLTDQKWLGALIQALHESLLPYLQNKTITSILNDTYNRELERYGPASIATIEHFFHVDSQLILQFLSLIEGSEGEECRWRFGLKLVHDLLNQFDLSWPQRVDLTGQQATSFGKEFGYNAALKKQLDLRHKALDSSLEELFSESNQEHQFFYDLCHQRIRQLQSAINSIRGMIQRNELEFPLDDLLGSLIHMTVNRLFRSRQRFVEYAIYYHLHKYYRTAYGRIAHGQPVTTQPTRFPHITA